MTRWPILLVGAILAGGCDKKAETPAATNSAAPAVTVSQPIDTQEVTDYEAYIGEIHALDVVQVRPRVGGQIVKCYFEAGYEVQADEPLYLIDPRSYDAQYDRAKEEIARNKAVLVVREKDLARNLEIRSLGGAVTQKEIEQNEAAVAAAKADVNASQAALKQPELNKEWTVVRAPIAGRVDRNEQSVGNIVVADSTVLTTIVSIQSVYAEFEVDQATVLELQKNMREGRYDTRGRIPVAMSFGSRNEFPYTGYIESVRTMLDASTGTINVRAIIPNSSPVLGAAAVGGAPVWAVTRIKQWTLTPGLSVRVRVPLSQPRKPMLVAESAIGTDQSQRFVYVVNDKNVIEYRPVQVGTLQAGGLRIVTPITVVRTKEGVRPAKPGEAGEPSLKASEWIIVAGLQRARPGLEVTPTKTKMTGIR